MFAKVLVANRGAVAARVIRALRGLGVRSVAVYSEADAGAGYLAEADEAHAIGPAPARDSYLNQDRLLEVAALVGADAVHPGYGFLSENASFARRVEAAGLAFIGPSPRWIEAMGEKTSARTLMARHGMPMAAGSGWLGAADAAMEAERIGYPVLVKPAAGGGGIGMLAAHDEAALLAAVERSRAMATRSFASAQVYLEKLVLRPRHVEFQMLGDRHGNVRHLFERDCSVQRRHQKVIEESPAPGVEAGPMAERAARILAQLGYDNIGTVEMLLGDDGAFNFLEMNTRLQVEHAVTEMVTGVDLVAAMIQVAAGERLDAVLPAEISVQGHAIEARVYAEDPVRFLPSPGPLQRFRPPAQTATLRVETGYREGMMVTPHYDPLLAKLIAHAPTRDGAIAALNEALASFEVQGIKTNIAFIQRVLASDAFRAGQVHTGLAQEIS
jgi:acetyl-CoA carboxylase biotin carboxylase subunit